MVGSGFAVVSLDVSADFGREALYKQGDMRIIKDGVAELWNHVG